MAKAKRGAKESAQAFTSVSPETNKNFRARITYKSGASQEFLIVASATNAFELMRRAFLQYLSGGSPESGFYTLQSGSVVVLWSDVSSFHEWIE